MKRFFTFLLAILGVLLGTVGCSDSDKETEVPIYSVTFNSHGGTEVEAQTLSEGQKVSKPTDPVRYGYIFSGWFKEGTYANEWDFDTDVVMSNLTLHAYWIAEDVVSYTVTFNTQGGSTISPRIVAEGQKIAEPNAPTKDGYIFSGWYKEAACENAWDFDNDVVNSDLTLYAYWVASATYTVTFDTQGGSEISDVTVIEGQKVTKPQDPEKDDFYFDGWFKEAECENPWDFDSDVVTEDITLYALWGTEIIYENAYFIATDGDDSNPGTFRRPFATLPRAYQAMEPGDTIFIREGTYVITEDQIMGSSNSGLYACVFDFSEKSGTSSKRICVWGFRDERPVFDLSQVKPANQRVAVFYVSKHYHHFKNFEVVSTQVTITDHTQSECFRNDGGNNNIYENLSMHDGMAIGFYLTRGMNNLVLNCDAYNNYDPVSENGSGGNVDGFGAHVPNSGHTGNVFRGCRAWWNSDDGFDLINAFAPVTIENCWAFYNGYKPNSTTSAGDGSGFKSGGYGMESAVDIDFNNVPRHTVRGCLAYYNKNQGFYANHHLGGINFYNNTGYRNPSNFNMLNRLSPELPAQDDPDGGYGHIIKNNLSYSPRTSGLDIINVNHDRCEIGMNSFLPTAMSLSDADFISLDENELTRPRQADGSLPVINFLRPKTTRLIGVGDVIGEDYTGTTLGCFQ